MLSKTGKQAICPRCGGRLTRSTDPNEEPLCIMCGFQDYGTPLDMQQEIERRQAERRERKACQAAWTEPPTSFLLAPKRPRCDKITQEGIACQNPQMDGRDRCWTHSCR